MSVVARHWRDAEVADVQVLFDQPSQFVNSEDSTTLGSGHRHPA